MECFEALNTLQEKPHPFVVTNRRNGAVLRLRCPQGFIPDELPLLEFYPKPDLDSFMVHVGDAAPHSLRAVR